MNGIGPRLQAARERARLSVVQAAEKLHVDPSVINALETEQFGELGAPVYVRGHLRHYAELVKESAPELLALHAANTTSGPPPDLTLMPHAKQTSSVRGALVFTGLALVIGVGLVGSIHWVNLDLRPAAPGASAPPLAAIASAPVVPAPSPEAASTDEPTAAAASSAPQPSAPPAVPLVKPARVTVAQAGVTLKFNSACWTQVYDARGRSLYRAIGAAGEVANLHGPAPLRVVIGNVAVVEVETNGAAQTIPAVAQAGRTAEFLVTPAGDLEPVRTVTTAGNKP